MIKVYNNSQLPIFQRLLSNKNAYQRFFDYNTLTFNIHLKASSSTISYFNINKIDNNGNILSSEKLDESEINYNSIYDLLQYSGKYEKDGLFQFEIKTSDNLYKTEPFYIINALYPKLVKYGYLYNWTTATDSNFSPEGWHLPTQAEFEILINYLGGQSLAGKALKTKGLLFWDSPNYASNSSQFYAVGSGIYEYNTYSYLKSNANFLISDAANIKMNLYSGNISANIESNVTSSGLSVRLIKDDALYNPTGKLQDFDGNKYSIVKIGNQVWMAENYSCTKLKDGSDIPYITGLSFFSTNIVRTAYDDDLTNVFL